MPAETLASLLGWGRGRLIQARIETAQLDARLLLQHATDSDHATLIGRPDTVVADAAAARYRDMIMRRTRHEPVSRIIGRREFYGRDFALSPATLDPRPDTETLVAAALDALRQHPAPHILDLGTGTGAIAITLLAELPGARAMATDVSLEALETAAGNARKHCVVDRMEFVQSFWFDAVTGCFDLIISNPPYLSAGDIESLDPEVKDWDPRRALEGGPDGLDCYRAIAKGAPHHLLPAGLVVVEIGSGRGTQVAEIFAEYGFELGAAHRDLAGHVRCLVFRPRKNGGWKRP
ncbi:MAG: peptide chain release factor N(5)-glutamine methyltransferase [Rhizobiales bacterium]|nr:peptide chain release factor N(5)-glutamine methyltransferase [Hyphomicrobiales bacterium]